jgi:hypothetical protein
MINTKPSESTTSTENINTMILIAPIKANLIIINNTNNKITNMYHMVNKKLAEVIKVTVNIKE